MKVAICDDLKECLVQMENLLQQIPDIEQVTAYSDMSQFYEDLWDGKFYDVIFMDIDWKQEKTGIDFAEELLKCSPTSQIVYVTAYTMDYVEDIFLTASNLSGFLIKPVKMEQLEKNLEKIRRRQLSVEGKLLIKQKGTVVAISQQDIIYLESQLHKVNIVLKDATYQCNEQLSAVKKRLNDQFLVIHKSYLVNMDCIRELKNGEVLLNNDKILSVSKTKASEAKKRFFEYMSRRI